MITTTQTNIPHTHLAKAPGFPHRGWRHLDCVDRQTADNLCQYCGKRHVRYVHVLSNPDWPQTIDTGCVCAADLGLEEEASKAERDVRNRTSRLERFLVNGWKISKNGNPYRTYCNVRIAICSTRGDCKICINSQMGQKFFRYQKEAMTHAFNYIEKQRL
jgi:hypothetical protein